MRKITDIAYTAEADSAHLLDLYLPDGDGFPLFVFFHGGGIDHGDKTGDSLPMIAEYLVGRGIGFASANYRLYPDAKYPDFIEDCASAVAWVKENAKKYGSDGRILVGGSSAGAYISMMLCYDGRYLGRHGICPTDITAYVHDAGQPTTHFNVLRERGENSLRCIIDEAAPLYYVGRAERYAPQLFFVAEHDMVCRYDQLKLLVATLKCFGCDEKLVKLEYMLGFKHTAYLRAHDDDGESTFGKRVLAFLREQGIVG